MLNGARQLSQNEFVGLCTKGDSEFKSNSASLIEINERAEAPFDVALGKINLPFRVNSPIGISMSEVQILADVHAYGYPEMASEYKNNFWGIGVRAQKGYVQRIIGDGSMPNEDPPYRFETNFLIGVGMSGAPLLNSYGHLIGICVGSARSEIIDDQFTQIDEDGSKYLEVRLKIQEYGISHAISSLIEWRPEILQGKTLGEIF